MPGVETASPHVELTAGGPPATASARTRPRSFPRLGKREPQDVRERDREIGVAGRRAIHEPPFEVGPEGDHRVGDVGAAEAAMPPLPLLQRRVGDVDLGPERIVGIPTERLQRDDDRGRREARAPREVDVTQAERARHRVGRTVDEQTVDVVLSQKERRHLRDPRGVTVGHVDEIRPTVRRDDHLALVRALDDAARPQEAVPLRWVFLGANRRVARLAVEADRHPIWIAQLQPQVLGDVDRHEARRQVTGANVGRAPLCRRALRGVSLGVDVSPTDRRKPVVRGHDDIGRRGERGVALHRREDTAEGIVGVVDRAARRRPVDAGGEVPQAVALVVLRGVRISRPEHQHERFSPLLELGEDHLGDGVGQELLLPNVGHPRPRRLAAARIAIVLRRRRLAVPRGRRRAAERGGQRCGDRRIERDPFRGSGPVVEEDRRRHLDRAITLRDVLNQRRPDLPDGRGAEAVDAGDGEQRLFAEVVAAGLGVELSQDLVVLDEGRSALEDLRAVVERVGEVAGVAQLVSRGERRGVGGGDRRIERVAVGEEDALLLQPDQRRRVGRIQRRRPQPVGDEENDVARPGPRLG